jgi:hypothetical protein
MIGYDCRVSPRSPVEIYEDNRISQFLIRTDVSRVISVDTYIWPTLFEPPVLTYDLAEVKQLPRDTEIAETWEIGVSLEISLPQDLTPWQDMCNNTVPKRPQESWQSLGFDVADQFLLSSLTNCAFPDTERAAWAVHLNANHLFSDLYTARKYREFSDMNVSEHAPFYVFCVWGIDITPKEWTARDWRGASG